MFTIKFGVYPEAYIVFYIDFLKISNSVLEHKFKIEIINFDL